MCTVLLTAVIAQSFIIGLKNFISVVRISFIISVLSEDFICYIEHYSNIKIMPCDNTEIQTDIGKMLLGAWSKKVISAYAHDFSASRTSNIQAMYKFNLAMLEPYAEFLNVTFAVSESY